MTNQTPLNQDALEAAHRLYIGLWDDGANGVVAMKEAIQAYLTVAPPVVNSVNELDALPAGSVVRDRHGRVWTAFEPRVSMPGVEYYRWMCPDGGFIRRKGWFSDFPATVLYRPEVEE